MNQASLFDSCLPNYVQHCLEHGGRIVKGSATGMILCPACQSVDLEIVWSGDGIAGHKCKCGHDFKVGEEAVLTFPKDYA